MDKRLLALFSIYGMFTSSVLFLIFIWYSNRWFLVIDFSKNKFLSIFDIKVIITLFLLFANSLALYKTIKNIKNMNEFIFVHIFVCNFWYINFSWTCN